MNTLKNPRAITTLIIIVVLVIVLAVVFGGKKGGQYGPDISNLPGSGEEKGAQGSAPAASYTASADSFSVSFAGTPQVTPSSYTSATAGNVPVTTYKTSAPGGASDAYYEVTVYHYPASYTFAKEFLPYSFSAYERAVASKYPGAEATKQVNTTLAGSPAIMGAGTVPASSGVQHAYVTAAVHGQDLYFVAAYGVDEASYSAFMNSFSFTD